MVVTVNVLLDCRLWRFAVISAIIITKHSSLAPELELAELILIVAIEASIITKVTIVVAD